MVSRTAYTQLGYSPLVLAGTILGLLLTYIAPVALAVFARRLCAIRRHFRLGLDGGRVPANLAILRHVVVDVLAVGGGAAGNRRNVYGVHDAIPPISMPAAAAVCGKAARKAMFPNCDD